MELNNLTTFEVGGKKCVALVRKLTEKEVFRLMGVDDSDTQKIADAGICRSAMYRLAGNSIVVDVLYSIFRKMLINKGNESAQMSIFDMPSVGKIEYTKDKPLRSFEAFAGYGSQMLALKRLQKDYPNFRVENVGISEIDQDAITAYNAIHGETKNYGDISKIDWDEVPDFDLFTYSYPCFIAGTLVLTDNGFKNIEDIEVGDMVMTHNDRFRRVTKLYSKPCNEIIKVKGMGTEGIYCTKNHPFYVRKLYRYGHKGIRAFREPEWKNASELVKGDYLGIPVNQESKLPEWDGTKLHNWGHNIPSNKLSAMFEDGNFWYVVGRYIGDGWVRDTRLHKSVVICYTERNDKSLLDAVNSLGFNATITKERTTMRCIINCKEFLEFLDRYGHYAHGKHIDGGTLDLPKHLLKRLLDGYIDSDGYLGELDEYKISSVSRDLIYGVQQIIAKVHNAPSRIYYTKRPKTTVIEGRTVNQRDTYQIVWHNDRRKQDKAFYEDGYCWYPFNGWEETDKEEMVYNMEVEEDNSYTANGTIVHNCTDISQAGEQQGFTEGSGTRSSLLWECRKAIEKKRPRYLLLENVAALLSEKFKPEFDKWRRELHNFGYDSYTKILNAKTYGGIPQNRERVFMVSIYSPRHDSNFYFPEPIPLKKKLKDMLEENTDIKYYLNPSKVQQFVKDNIPMINKYAKEDNGDILPLPNHIKEWLEAYEESAD